MKKLFTVLLLMLMVTVPASVNAQTSGVCGTNQNATWSLDANGVFTISGKGEIPNFVESNLPWASIRNQIKTVVIEEGITSIGGTSFYQCTNLKNVSLPDSLKSIGTSAFSGCTSLNNIEFPDNLETIGLSTFYNCTSMTKIVLPIGLKNINNWSFAYCTNVSEIVWNSVALLDLTVDVRAFPNVGNNTDGVKVIFADGVNYVPAYAIYGCSAVKNIVLPDTLEGVGTDAFKYTAFYDDKGNWSNGVLYIGNNLIKANSLSGEYAVKEGTRFIAENAFSNCSALTGVTVPKSVDIIGINAFGSCTSLKEITLPFVGRDRHSSMLFGYVFGNQIPAGLSYVTITDANEICDFAFYGCEDIKNITINSGISKIGAYAFNDCISLVSISLPDTVRKIGEKAFYNTAIYNNWDDSALYICGNLIDVDDTLAGEFMVLDGTKCMADDVFSDCTNLTKITLSDSIDRISNYAFNNCSNLLTIDMSEEIAEIGSFAFNGCTSLKNVNIPDNVVNIGDYAFNKCTALERVILPEKIESVGKSAFSECESLTHIYALNSSLDRMLYDCESMKYAVIADGTKTVGAYAFSDNKELQKIVIPRSVTKIDVGAFENCTSLKEVKYEGSKEEWENIIIDINNERLLNSEIFFDVPLYDRFVYPDVKIEENTFIITPTGVVLNDEIIFVGYENDKAEYIERIVFDGTPFFECTPDKNYNNIKVFVWDNINSMKPLCDAVEIE